MDFQIEVPRYTAQHLFMTVHENQTVESNCCAITFFNKGETVVTIAGEAILLPGDQLPITGQSDTIDATFYPVVFSPEPGKKNALLVIKKLVV